MIQPIGEELAIAWDDGREDYFPMKTLRHYCPCAACGGEPDVLGRVDRPQVSYSEKSFIMTALNPVGGYAVQPRWSDGHSSGIYSFLYLRRLSEYLAQEQEG